eukprot:15382000-Alexandrium_andersonii.AAC.1
MGRHGQRRPPCLGPRVVQPPIRCFSRCDLVSSFVSLRLRSHPLWPLHAACARRPPPLPPWVAHGGALTGASMDPSTHTAPGR